MRDKRIKLIFFSFQGSDGKEVILSWGKVASLIFSTFVILLLLAGSLIAIFTDFYQNYRNEQLSQANMLLREQLAGMSEKVATIESRMRRLEKENDDLRVFADLPPINNDIRQVGVGGTDEVALGATLNLLPADLSDDIGQMHSTLEQLERRISLFIEERYEIQSTLNKKQKQLNHLPSVRPVIEGRISDRFGLRIDPFTEVQRHHDGLDISAREGTNVYATASGKVILAKNSYVPGRGYGKEIVIDHGNGICTRYAHLSKLTVKTGQKVDRWQIIGYVGQTGRTTGPHLHYEVMVKSKPVDPNTYIIL